MEQFNYALLVPIIGMLGGFFIAIIAIIMGVLEKQKYYETVKKLIESGKSAQEIKELLGEQDQDKTPAKYLNRGIILLGVAVGLVLFAFFVETKVLTGAGLLIGVIGISFLIIYFLQRKLKET